MKTLYPLHGIITVLNTPFTISDTIDTHALRAHVTVALDAGVAGFLVPAMASEVYKLSTEERLSMVASVLEVVNGKVPVFAGAGDPDPGRAAALIEQYMSLGCTHVLVQIPFEDEKQFRSHFMQLAALRPEVLMLQDWDTGGPGLPDKLILELFEEVECFRCLKVETAAAGLKYSRILELTQGRLHVSGGWAVGQMIEGLMRGVHAFMPTGMHFIYTRIFNDFRAGKIKEAEALFEKILPVLAFSNQQLDISILFFKRLLHRQGIYPNANVRQPSLAFDDVHAAVADRLIQRVIELEESLRADLHA